jgi:hypothetical protein
MSKKWVVLSWGWAYQIILLMVLIQPLILTSLTWWQWSIWGGAVYDFLHVRFFMLTKSGRDDFVDAWGDET